MLLSSCAADIAALKRAKVMSTTYRCFLHVTMTIDSRSSCYEFVFMFCVLDAKVNATEVNDAFLIASLIFHSRTLIKTIKHIKNYAVNFACSLQMIKLATWHNDKNWT